MRGLPFLGILAVVAGRSPAKLEGLLYSWQRRMVERGRQELRTPPPQLGGMVHSTAIRDSGLTGGQGHGMSPEMFAYFQLLSTLEYWKLIRICPGEGEVANGWELGPIGSPKSAKYLPQIPFKKNASALADHPHTASAATPGSGGICYFSETEVARCTRKAAHVICLPLTRRGLSTTLVVISEQG